MNITSNIFIVFALLSLSVAAAYSQDCNSYLQRATELVSQKQYCDAKRYYQDYGKCNADADVDAEIAICERLCRVPEIEGAANEEVGRTEQDIIILRNGNEIQAMVSEIGIDDVTYKRFDNPNGPTYTLKKSEIFMIRYANGSKDVFTDNTVPTVLPPPSQSTTTSSYRGDDQYRKYSFLQMNDNEQERYLQVNHPELYGRFHKGQKLSGVGRGLRIPGWILFSSGLGLIIGGAADEDEELMSLGTLFFSAGNTLILISIPFSAVGGGMKKSVQNEYKERYLRQANSQGQFQLRMSGNGIGLAYVF